MNVRAVGAPAGPTSSMQYAMRFVEKYHADRPRVARKDEGKKEGGEKQ